MPFVLHDPRFDTVVRLLRSQEHGVSLAAVRTQFSPPLPTRTVQRMLTSLVEIGALTSVGAKRNRRYILRVKPGAFGSVNWFDPDSQVGQMVAPEPPPAAGKKKVAAVVSTATQSAAKVTIPTVKAPGAEAEPATSTAPVGLPPLPTTKSIVGARVEEVVARLVLGLVSQHITPDRIELEMKNPAALFALKPGETVEDATVLVTAALDRITIEAAAKYQIPKPTFAEWREIKWPAGYALEPRPAVAPLPPLPLPPNVTEARLPLFLREVSTVVTKPMKREQVRPYIETQKNWLRGSETVDDWVAVLTAELDRLRLDDAVTVYHIRPDQFRWWRARVWTAVTAAKV